MTTVSTDPPADDDLSHELLADEDPPGAPNDLDAHSEEELEAVSGIEGDALLGGARATYPSEDVDSSDEP
ncbi:MAG: hypothetical protein M3499_06500 [Actinomycetota bacterium]|nr:hypothetical protein [Actinomycetota bacterium]